MSRDILRESIATLVGLTCVALHEGEGTGTVLGIDFDPAGDKLRLTRASKQSRKQGATPGLLIECAWRLDSSGGVICGGWDDNSPDGIRSAGLARLIGARLVSAELEEPGFDMKLQFSKSLTLGIFCDQVNAEGQLANYSIFWKQGIVEVGLRSVIAVHAHVKGAARSRLRLVPGGKGGVH